MARGEDFVVDGDCGNLPKKSLKISDFERFERGPFWENSGRPGGTPSPLPWESRDWRGVCKNGLQDLERLGFRGQNLERKGLAVFFAVDVCTASALTMICSFGFEVKVGCHKAELWKTCSVAYTNIWALVSPAKSPTLTSQKARR